MGVLPCMAGALVGDLAGKQLCLRLTGIPVQTDHGWAGDKTLSAAVTKGGTNDGESKNQAQTWPGAAAKDSRVRRE